MEAVAFFIHETRHLFHGPRRRFSPRRDDNGTARYLVTVEASMRVQEMWNGLCDVGKLCG